MIARAGGRLGGRLAGGRGRLAPRELAGAPALAPGRPRGRHAYLGSLASAGGAAGFALLERLCARADAAGEVLCLDTTGPRLVGEYGRRGFAVTARGALPWGAAVTTVRRPCR